MATSYIAAPGMAKAPEYATTAAPVPANTANSGNFWEGLGAAGWGALNSALFDIPEYLAKNIAPSETYKALKDLEARNQGAFTAGQIAGMFVPTGGLVAKGVGTGLKGAKAALEAAKLGKFATYAGKGAKALDTASDIIRGTKATSGIGGGIARGALSAAEQAIPRAAMAVSEGQDLGTAGKQALTSTALGGAIGGGIGALGKARGLLGEVATEYAGKGKKAVLKQVGILPESYEYAAREAQKLAGGGRVQPDLLKKLGIEITDTASDYIEAKGIPIRAEAFKNAFAGTSQADIADDILRVLPGTSPQAAKATAATIQHSLAKGEGLAEAADLTRGIGSLMKNPLLTGAIAGGGLSAGKDILEGKTPSTSTLQNALLGAAAMKYGPRMLAKAAPALEKIAGAELPGIAGKVAPAVGEALMKAPGILGVETTPADDKAIEKIENTEAQVTPAGQEQAKYQLSEKYAQKIADNIQQAWLSKYAAQGVEYEDFVRALAKRTDNFEPKKSAAILFPDKTERAKFLKDYDIALKLQGMDVEAAYRGKGANWVSEHVFQRGNAAEAKLAYDNLVDTLASTLATPGSLPSATERRVAEADLEQIMSLPPTAGAKRDILLKRLADKYGLSLTMLQDLGLV